MINYFKRKISNLDLHTVEVINKSSSSFVVKFLGMVAGIGVSIYLGRTLGADGLGIINLTLKIVGLIAVLVLLGIPQLLIRVTAIANQENNLNRIKKYMSSAILINGTLSFIISIILIASAEYLSINLFQDERIKLPLIIASIAMTPMVLSRIFSSGLIGFKKIWQSNLVNETLSSIIIGFLLLSYYLFGKDINIIVVAYIYAFSRFVVTTTVSFIWLIIYRKKNNGNSFSLEKQNNRIVKKSLPFLLISIKAALFANVDSIMIGWLSNAENVGLYTISARMALLTGFFLQITNSSVSPKLAAMFSQNKIKEMNFMVQKVTLGLLIIGLISLLIFTLYGRQLLGIWGFEFRSAYNILIILTIGQVFNVGTGAAGLILVMCGYENLQAKISVLFLILNIGLNYILIVRYQALGAAVATAITISLENITKVYFAKNKIGVSTISLTFLKKKTYK